MKRLSNLRRLSLWLALFALLLTALGCAPTAEEPDSLANTAGSAPAQLPQQTDLAADESLLITHGPLSGEVSATGANLWARGSEPGTLQFTVIPLVEELDEEEDPLQDSALAEELFATAEGAITATAVITTAQDLTGAVQVVGLEPGQLYLYQVALATEAAIGEPRYGRFQTAPDDQTAAPFNFVFGGCLGGQGYCRTEEGWVIFDEMAATSPEFFLLIGDGVYLDTACSAEGIIPGAEGPYTDLEGFRTRYRYHLEDPPYANFLAQVPIIPTWDDHEIINDAGGPALNAINPQLFQDSWQAFFEYWPITANQTDPNQIYRQISYGTQADFFVLDTRSYRDPNVNWDPHPRNLTPKTMLGAEQFAWLQAGLLDSTATWKFIVSSVPLSYPTGFPQPEVDGRDGWANFTEKSGYETELLSLIFFLEANNVDNVIFLTGDTHWPFALSYDPDRNGQPNFYELSSSPLSAIPLAPAAALDPTLNPTVLYAEGTFMGDLFNFGHIAIDEAGVLTFKVIDATGTERLEWSVEPEGATADD